MTPAAPPKPFLKPDDILYLLVRHRWKLVLALIAGLVLGAVVWLTKTPNYISEARIMVRYVMETRSLGPVSGVRQIKDTDQGAASVLNSELQIVTSQDLMDKVVADVGAKKIAPNASTNSAAAVAAIAYGLTVQVPTRSDVILLNFRHSNPEVARDVLNSLIKAYLEKHKEIHHSADSFEFLQEQTDAMRTRLAQTEDELRKIRSEAGIVSLDAARIEIPARIASVRKSVLDVESELAEAIALAGAHLNTNAAATNSPAASASASANIQPPLVHQSSPSEALSRERAIQLSQQLASLKTREAELLISFTPESKPLQRLQRQMADLQQELDAIPLADRAPAPQFRDASPTAYSERSLTSSISDRSRVYALQAKYQLLTNQLAMAIQDSKKFEANEDRIRALERRRELEENQYKYFYTGLEQTKIDNALDSGKINNISIVQSPSIGYRSKDNLVKAGGVAVAPLLLVLAFILFTDVLFPTSYNRGKDLEATLKVPVLVSIPHYGVNGHSKLKAKTIAPTGHTDLLAPASEIPPWDPEDPMLKYYEALRDRVVMSYSGDPHKPKIVGLTSTNHGAGVSRIATGLAAALSRDVERSVLYIALEKNKVAVSAFDKGRPAENIPFEQKTAELHEPNAIVERNLYSLATVGRGITGASIVQTFSDLMPRLKATDYDYIVFDLPPLSQTSGSLRLAAQMERTFLVVEAEKSSRQSLEKAKSVLNDRPLFAVFNKANPHSSEPLEV